MVKQRNIRANVTWVYPKSTTEEKILCIHCRRYQSITCERKKLPKRYQEMVAIRCRFFLEKRVEEESP